MMGQEEIKTAAAKTLALVFNQINKTKKGQDPVTRIGYLGEMKALDIDVIPTGSLALDAALGVGGYPIGRIIEIYGAESAGKSSLCLHAIAEAQKLGFACAYIDVEHTLDPSYARALNVNIDALAFSQPDDGDEAMRIVDVLIRSGQFKLIVVDSVASLVTAAEMEKEVTDNNIGTQARLMSQALRRFTTLCGKSNTTILFTNQLRNKVGGYGNPETTSGGNALKYYASVRLDIRRKEPIKSGEEVLGAVTQVKVVKNKVARPFNVAFFNIMYGKGIDQSTDAIATACDMGIVTKTGHTYSYEGEKLGVGLSAAIEALSTRPETIADLRASVLEAVKLNKVKVKVDEDEDQPGEDTDV